MVKENGLGQNTELSKHLRTGRGTDLPEAQEGVTRETQEMKTVDVTEGEVNEEPKFL